MAITKQEWESMSKEEKNAYRKKMVKDIVGKVKLNILHPSEAKDIRMADKSYAAILNARKYKDMPNRDIDGNITDGYKARYMQNNLVGKFNERVKKRNKAQGY